MGTYTLTDETSIDVLIFWVESADGSISFAEQAAVKRVLDNMNYDMTTYQETLSHIAAMSSEHIQEIVSDAIVHVKKCFSDEGKQLTYALLEAIAGSDGKISGSEKEKLDRIKSDLGL